MLSRLMADSFPTGEISEMTTVWQFKLTSMVSGSGPSRGRLGAYDEVLAT